ncbi:uncharacterized protein N7496_010822 [Penicillium cataractarum]|uniref:Hydrophobin n=1 Tax=Penicillium cataractarum TaxID=2100454 RepID=A0A9W9RFN4_9EURO|nr:uncharacterized protein N7496_010822 [Penicillium cataractarum]KAJ5358409.1 hypothetical protein N7496_010822 [Penicillium cataractarum]
MFVKSILVTLGLSALAIAGSTAASCSSDQQVVCKDNGNGGLLTLGNVLPGGLGVSCSGGDVYCCDKSATQDGNLINLDVNAQCSLNHLL